ncbi:MAG: class I SAM-dependent methyltransferase [Lentimicrobiaceae bacterium]|jgi:SAM-dependent methyltransferase|nr:class I SAM-dependent methyltransferase [Lentimicrobiaceae bacterium]
MQYDPIKRSLGTIFNKTPFLRKLFYQLLDLLLLRTWHIKRNLKKWAKENCGTKAILDAGSGFGQYTYYMARKNVNWNILGIDVKEEQIADCNNFFKRIRFSNVHFEKGDLTKLDFKAIFDLILCVDVMEHIEEDVLVFKNYYEALKEGGMALISTPSDQGGSDADHEHLHDEDSGISGFIDEHVRDGYNIDELKQKLLLAGFKKTEIYYEYGIPGNISWKLSMKYPIQLLNISQLFFILLPFYYLITFPICLILNKIDVTKTHKTGTGLIAKAWK